MIRNGKSKHILFLSLLLFLAFNSFTAFASSVEEEVEEITEDAREGGEVGKKKGNFVAVPIPISNPTVGTGLQAVLLYLHPKRKDQTDSHNTTTGLVGMYTDTESWMAGLFHDDYWANDKYRFAGFVGYGELNLKFYGVGDNPILSENPLDYAFVMTIFAPQVQMRIPGTESWFIGTQYVILESDITFKLSNILPGLPDVQGNVRTAGLGLLTTYDTRNDNYYPTAGQWFEAKFMNYDDTWGGDYEYNIFSTYINHYQPIKDKTVLALRADGQFSDGDTPFFALPYIDLRGFARGRYQDEMTFSVQSEGRYKFHPRWAGVVFLGAGWFGKSLDNMDDNPTIYSYGCGVRWQITKDKPLNLAVDAAFSNDDSVIYMGVGEAF